VGPKNDIVSMMEIVLKPLTAISWNKQCKKSEYSLHCVATKMSLLSLISQLFVILLCYEKSTYMLSK